ncbi:MAG: hypothetical protein NNA31_11520 [Nitrospira sp.]|nr:hypothetical protein [Nitrospira sp.]
MPSTVDTDALSARGTDMWGVREPAFDGVGIVGKDPVRSFEIGEPQAIGTFIDHPGGEQGDRLTPRSIGEYIVFHTLSSRQSGWNYSVVKERDPVLVSRYTVY